MSVPGVVFSNHSPRDVAKTSEVLGAFSKHNRTYASLALSRISAAFAGRGFQNDEPPVRRGAPHGGL